MKEFVIERTNEMRREWWTGKTWTEDETQARWYTDEPDAPLATGDESAHAVRYESGAVVE
jgi:hypothetical protein